MLAIARLATTVIFLLLTPPLAADAQPDKKIPRIGWLGFGTPTAYAAVPLLDAFREGLREHGWFEGQNIHIEYRGAEGKTERYPLLAAELVRLGLDVLVTSSGEPAGFALKGATATIPIVMATSTDPVGTGLVASLARPGGNITGLTLAGTDVAAKRLELLKAAVPTASRIAVLWNAAFPGKSLEMRETQAAARLLGVSLRSVEIRAPKDLPGAFSAISNMKPHALITFADPLTNTERRQIVDFALRGRLPMISEIRPFADDGGLMTYGPSVTEMLRRAATYVDKILKGAKPGDLPIEQPTKFELVVNLKTAKSLNLTIPASLLARADGVIE
jgi:ABC-type uncharacterized transport system substrate-binding protein